MTSQSQFGRNRDCATREQWAADYKQTRISSAKDSTKRSYGKPRDARFWSSPARKRRPIGGNGEGEGDEE